MSRHAAGGGVLAYRAHAAWTIAGRELRSTLLGPAIYVVLSLIFLATSYFSIRNSLWQVGQNGLLVLVNPVNYPFFITTVLSASYLGLVSAIAISRERDQGTLEVLFYGPVDATSYILGKYLQQMAAFCVALLFALAYFLVMSAFTNLAFSANLEGLLVLSLFVASSMIGFGILLSSLTRRVILSVALFLALVIFFLGFSIAYNVVMAIPGDRLSTVLVYARIALDAMNQVLTWVSPLAYFGRGQAALQAGDAAQYAVSVASSAAYTVVTLGLAIVAFNRKGVRR